MQLQIEQDAPDMSKIAGGCNVKGILPDFHVNVTGNEDYRGIFRPDDSIYLENWLTEETCDEIIKFYESQGDFSPVSIQGRQDIPDDRIGSKRITCWDPQFGKNMNWAVGIMTPDRVMDKLSSTDWFQCGPFSIHEYQWTQIGISPMVRYMKYQTGGQHYAHYDAGFIYDDIWTRTLMSGVLYLTTNKTGATRFIDDGQTQIPVWKRDFRDWTIETPESQIVKKFAPKKGSILLFDHRICHDVEQYDGAEGDRTIIRFDVIFKTKRS
jgi:hypothetical protein